MNIKTKEDKDLYDKNCILNFNDNNIEHSIVIPYSEHIGYGSTLKVYFQKDPNCEECILYTIKIIDIYANKDTGIKIFSGNIIDEIKINKSDIVFRNLINVKYYSKNNLNFFDYIIEFPDWEGSENEEGDNHEGNTGNSDK